MTRKDNRLEARYGQPRTRRSTSVHLTLVGVPLLIVVLLMGSGCVSTPAPIFESLNPAMTWPKDPAKARIRYVGQLRSSDDLKKSPSAMERLSNLFAGKKEAAQLYGPRDVLMTGAGQFLWVADPGGRCVHLMDLESRSYRKITAAGPSQLVAPVGLAKGPGGSILICDSQSLSIHQVSDMTGEFIRSLRLPEDLLRPVSLSYRAEDESLFVVDVVAHDIKVLAMSGQVIRIIGKRGASPGQFNFPSDLVDDGEMIWVADTGNQRIQGLSYDGKPLVTFGQAGDAPGDLALPKAIATDRDGNLYVVDGRFENIQVFDRRGRLLLYFGEEGTGPGAFWLPSGLHIDSSDSIWVCDSYNHRLQVFERVRRSSEGESDSPVDVAGERSP